MRDKPQRPGRNPKTGEEIPITARRVVTFHASQKLKASVEKLIKADPDMPVMLRRAREQNVTGAEFLEWLETKKKGGK